VRCTVRLHRTAEAACRSSGVDDLARDTLLSVLPSDLSASLIRQADTVALAPDQTLFAAGDPCEGCYHVVEGLLKVTVAVPPRHERILAILGPGGFIGELSMMDGAPRSASVIAIRASKLYFISRPVFEGFGREHPELYRHIAGLLARRLRTNSISLAMSSPSVRAGTARALLSLADAFGKDVGAGRVLIRYKLSQTDLAGIAGVARENLSRVLQDWMRASLVSRLAGYYCIENKKTLEREADA
jgi:CRP/FNR family cyclic AMP-dependent transcriptional regulator